MRWNRSNFEAQYVMCIMNQAQQTLQCVVCFYLIRHALQWYHGYYYCRFVYYFVLFCLLFLINCGFIFSVFFCILYMVLLALKRLISFSSIVIEITFVLHVGLFSINPYILASFLTNSNVFTAAYGRISQKTRGTLFLKKLCIKILHTSCLIRAKCATA